MRQRAQRVPFTWVLFVTGVILASTARWVDAGMMRIDIPDTIEGRVVGIADGDTLTVLDQNNTQHKVRLAQIDAPEKSQAFGAAAKARLSALVFSKQVKVEVRDTDRYGRTVGTVWVNGLDANKEMIRSGLAWVYTQYATDPDLRRIEDEAKAARKGLWADPGSIPPWEYRRERRS